MACQKSRPAVCRPGAGGEREREPLSLPLHLAIGTVEAYKAKIAAGD
jgi:hypothetical protein